MSSGAFEGGHVRSREELGCCAGATHSQLPWIWIARLAGLEVPVSSAQQSPFGWDGDLCPWGFALPTVIVLLRSLSVWFFPSSRHSAVEMEISVLVVLPSQRSFCSWDGEICPWGFALQTVTVQLRWRSLPMRFCTPNSHSAADIARGLIYTDSAVFI